MARVHPVLTICAVVTFAMAAAGCSRLSARSAPEPPPPLDVPAPPPRVVETADAEPPNPGTLVDAPAGGAPSSRTPARVEAPKPESKKPESAPPPATVTVTEVPPVAPTEPATQATTLQTTPPEKEAALEQEIRAKLDRAMRDLDRVDYKNLPNPAKQQYDEAKRFAERADEAIKLKKNLVLAKALADNAAIIAAQLASR